MVAAITLWNTIYLERAVTLLGNLRPAIRLAGAIPAAHWLSSLLFGVGQSDPATYLGVAGLLCGVALIASGIPAWRASRIDPLIPPRND